MKCFRQVVMENFHDQTDHKFEGMNVIVQEYDLPARIDANGVRNLRFGLQVDSCAGHSMMS